MKTVGSPRLKLFHREPVGVLRGLVQDSLQFLPRLRLARRANSPAGFVEPGDHMDLRRQLPLWVTAAGFVFCSQQRIRRGRSRSGLVDLARRRSTRAARLGDGFIFFGGGVEHAVEAWQRLRDRVRGHGRSVEDFGGDYVVLPSGGIGDLTAEIGAWRDAGGTHVSVVTMGRGLDSVDGHIDFLASLAHAPLSSADVATVRLSVLAGVHGVLNKANQWREPWLLVTLAMSSPTP